MIDENTLREITAAAVEGAVDGLLEASEHKLYSDTGKYDYDREQHVRNELSIWVAYAEDGPSFDPDGNYLCGTCDMRSEPHACTHVSRRISMDHGSCRLYIHGPELEGKPPLPQKLTQIDAQYGERPKSKGFGCQRCEYGAEAKKPDKDGRPSWCSFWGVHVQPKSCCAMNEGPDSVNAPGEKHELEAYGTHSGLEKAWDTRGRGRNLPGTADISWKEAVLKAATKYPEKILDGLKVDWTDMHLSGSFAYQAPSRLLIGMGDVTPKYAIQHELGHRAYDLLSPELKEKGNKLFSKKWVVDSHITQPYKRAESGGTWSREDKRYEAMLILRKRIHEQAAEALRMYVMKEPLPVAVKAWAQSAIASLKEVKAAALWNSVKITGFTGPEEEGLRAMLSRIPPELLFNVGEIKSAKELNAKHGRFIPEERTILFNPKNFSLMQKFGEGDSKIRHPELTVVHEVGHSIYDTFSPDQEKEWQDLSGWREGYKIGQSFPYIENRPGWPKHISEWTHKLGVKFPRHYSERNPSEDFADCFAFTILGKGFMMADDKKAFIDNFISTHVHKYPQVSIESPIKASDNLYNNIKAYGTSEGLRKAWDERGRGRSERAKETYVRQTSARWHVAAMSEQLVAKAVGGHSTGMTDHKWNPFDVIKGKVGVEVKTLLPGAKNDKITMHPKSRRRKLEEAEKMGFKKAYTVAIDLRADKAVVYIKKGLGSFRLGSMTNVGSFKGLRQYI